MKEDILKKLIKGDRAAFAKFYNEHFDALWRYTYSRIKCKETSSDIISDSFISLYENIKNIKHHKAIKSYLYRIVRNKMIKYYKRQKTVTLDESKLDRIELSDKSDESISDGKRRKKLSIQLEKILTRLPKNYEEVLRLRFLADLKIKEVAKILDKSENNVKVIQNRAIKKAKEYANFDLEKFNSI